MSGICFGWYANGYYGKPKIETREIIRVDTLKVPPVIRTKIQWRTQLPPDPNEPTTYKYSFDEDSIKFVVVIESQIEPMDVMVKDFYVQPTPIVRVDTFRYEINSYVTLDTLKVNNEKLMLLSGGLASGYFIGKEDYKSAGVTLAITFVSVYFYDTILNIWKWL